MLSGSRLLSLSSCLIPHRALRPFGRPTALVFHGVARRIEDPRIEINHHTVDAFAALTRTLKDSFDVLPLEAIDDVLKNPERHPRAVFLTSDDGYLNTLTNAADILDDRKLPWVLFVSTRHIETGEPNPLFCARLFLHFAPDGRYDIPHLPAAIELGAERGKTDFATIGLLKRLDMVKAREAIAAMTSALPVNRLEALRARFSSERFLTWSDVAALSARGVEIGAHADWHWPMNGAQMPEHIVDQASGSRSAVVAHVGRCRFFAYPFGNVSDIAPPAWQAVRDAGFSHAFTTMSATLDAGRNPWLLPRYALMPEEQNLQALLPMLRAGNARLVRWQRALAA
jgi:peptidoglycan/xylan/chitin deacetylase (PgdA/CDA1 family)